MQRSAVRLEGLHCSVTLERPRDGVVLVTLVGTDVGEFGDLPFRELDHDVAAGAIDLFIDARGGKAASIDVSGEWARWMRERRGQLRGVHMLTATRLVEPSADLVRRFAGLEGAMRLYTDAAAFEDALAQAGDAV
jgi:hypothetical protein